MTDIKGGMLDKIGSLLLLLLARTQSQIVSSGPSPSRVAN